MPVKPVFLVSSFLLLTPVIKSQRIPPLDSNGKHLTIQYGIASYYADKFEGRETSSGEKFSQKKMTAAHNTLPFGTWVRVTNLKNHRSIIVRINDRLHYKNKRLIDLSREAAKKLGYIGAGIARVKLQVLGKGKAFQPSDQNE